MKELTLTQEDIWKEIRNLKPAQNSKPPDINTLFNRLNQIYHIPDTAEIRQQLKYQLKLFNQKGKKCASQSVVLRIERSDEEEVDSPAVKKRKSFTDISGIWKHERMKPIMNEIEKLVNEENHSHPGIELTSTKITGHILHTLNYQTNKKTARVGQMIYEGKSVNVCPEFSTADAIALMHDLTLTKEQMRKMKSYMQSKGIYFPNTNELLEGRKLLRPVVNVVLDGNGVSVDYTKLVSMTTASLIKNIEHSGVHLNESEPLKVVYKEGGDTAGSQTVWSSSSMIDASDHLFQYSIVPLRVIQENKIVWLNPSPNSATSCRPVYLLRASEDEERVINLVFPDTDRKRSELHASQVPIEGSTGCVYAVQHEMLDTMKDLKLKNKLPGIGRGDCILCETRKSDWKDAEKIREGFPITRTAEGTRELYEKLMAEGNGEIQRKASDYDERLGLTQEAQTSSDQHSICILHSYINVLGWFLKVLYRCNCSYESWIERQTVLGEPIRRSKKRVQEILRPAGLVVDRVAGANAKTGTSNTGNTARNFFNMKNRDVVITCVDEKYKLVLNELHKKISVLLRIISSSSQVDYMKVQELATTISLLISEELPWVEINWSLHGLLHHSAELIYLNGGWSLEALSEEALESNNKFCRRYLDQYSRTTSPELQLTDTMNRLLERSDPQVQERQRRVNRKLKCDICQLRHKTKNHSNFAHLQKSSVLNEDDCLVNDILCC